MKDQTEDVGTEACQIDKIVESRVKCDGHMVRLNDVRLPKRAETKKQGGRRKRGRREDCLKTDLRKAEEDFKSGVKRSTTGSDGKK